MHKVKIDGKIGRGFQNRVKFEYVFLRKYLDDFLNKNMLRISTTYLSILLNGFSLNCRFSCHN
jgi:hypothetical protein